VRGAQSVYKSQRADGKWVYEVRHPGAKRLYEVVGTRLDQAKARAREIHGDAAPPVVSVGTTLGEVVEDWRRTRRMRKRSADNFDAVYRVHIEPRFGRMKVRDINKRLIYAWIATGLNRKDGRDGDLAGGTKRLALATLMMLLAHAVEMGALGAVPKLDRKRTPKAGPGRTRILTPDEERTLLAYTAPFPWLRPVILVTLHQALRSERSAACSGRTWTSRPGG
jgi:hypothetical protein